MSSCILKLSAVHPVELTTLLGYQKQMSFPPVTRLFDAKRYNHSDVTLNNTISVKQREPRLML